MSDYRGQLVLCFNPGHRTGQRTSQKADEEANENFKAIHCDLVYKAVNLHCNGGTAKEIAKAGRANEIDLTDEQVHKRLHDLRDCRPPLLKNGKSRVCQVSEREVLTWWVI